VDNAAVTVDGGATWTAVKGLSGFRSVASFLTRGGSDVIAVGPLGSDLSRDGGKTWTAIEGPGGHTFSVAPRGKVGFGAGEKGTIARLNW
jgi:hypothetical protein